MAYYFFIIVSLKCEWSWFCDNCCWMVWLLTYYNILLYRIKRNLIVIRFAPSAIFLHFLTNKYTSEIMANRCYVLSPAMCVRDLCGVLGVVDARARTYLLPEGQGGTIIINCNVHTKLCNAPDGIYMHHIYRAYLLKSHSTWCGGRHNKTLGILFVTPKSENLIISNAMKTQGYMHTSFTARLEKNTHKNLS